jgi:hypothetical protein
VPNNHLMPIIANTRLCAKRMNLWEYPLSALRALCRPCHVRREQTEIRLRAFAASLTSDQLDALRPALNHATYWYETAAVFSFLSALGPEEQHLQAAMQILRNAKNEHD